MPVELRMNTACAMHRSASTMALHRSRSLAVLIANDTMGVDSATLVPAPTQVVAAGVGAIAPGF